MNTKPIKEENKLDRILTIILVTAIALTAYIIVTPKEGEHFTEFYIFGANGTANNYPTDLTIGEEGKLIIGIVNHTMTLLPYLIPG